MTMAVVFTCNHGMRKEDNSRIIELFCFGRVAKGIFNGMSCGVYIVKHKVINFAVIDISVGGNTVRMGESLMTLW